MLSSVVMAVDMARITSNRALANGSRLVGRALCRRVEGFVFCASTGRSGTTSLSRILGAAVPGCVARHEPVPILHDEVMQAHNDGDDGVAREAFRQRKAPRIYRLAVGSRWYVETNHIFVKCFADAAIEEFGDRLQVVHLTRDHREVAASFLGRGSIPGRDRGDRWLLRPDAPRNEIALAAEMAEGARFDHPFFRCLWYCYEIDARVADIRRRHPEVRIHHLEVEDLNDPAAMRRLVHDLGMDLDEQRFAEVVATRANSSPQPVQLPHDLDPALVEEFERLCLERLAAVGAR